MSKKASMAAGATGLAGLAVGGMALLSGSGDGTEIVTEEEETQTVESVGTGTEESSGASSGSGQEGSSSTPTPVSKVKGSGKGMSGNSEIDFFKNHLGPMPETSKGYWFSWYFNTQKAKFDMESFDLSDSYVLDNSTKTEVQSFLGNYEIGDHGATKSSLRIISKKQQYANGKWKGSLSWFWTFMHGNKGFITFNLASTSKTNQKALDLVGGFYLVEKGENNKWKIKYHKEVDENAKKTLLSYQVNNYFPKPHWYTRSSGFWKVYKSGWNFLSDASVMNDICGANECKDQPKIENSVGAWEWAGDDWYDSSCDSWFYSGWCDKVYGWSSDASDKSELQWWDHMYGNNEFPLKKYLSSFYRGAWTRLY